MLYSSLLFIYGFFPAALGIYYITPRKFKDIALLLESMIFCGAFGLKYLGFIMIFTAVNYVAARLIYSLNGRNSPMRRIPFAAALIFDILSLFSFRSDILNFLSLKMTENFFAVGISMYTLSAIGYLIDVYAGKIKADVNFVRFALFIMMFPRLIMGPVVSYDYFVRILKNRRITMNGLGNGVMLFVKGLAKKIIFADTLYMLYSAIKSIGTDNIAAASAWMGIIAYTLCLYFTLCGFSEMGLGIAACFGLKFPSSFNYPILSSRIRYFCSRWNIQIVQWFRKYIISPISELTESKLAGRLGIILLWTIIGFWYGFNFSSALWGILMGAAILLENKIQKLKMLKSTGIIYTFAVTTVLAVFISNDSISASVHYFFAMIGGTGVIVDQLTTYFLRSYVVALIITMYAATDLFKNMISRLMQTRFRIVVSIFKPVVMMALFAICTALISYSGCSEMILVRL